MNGGVGGAAFLLAASLTAFAGCLVPDDEVRPLSAPACTLLGGPGDVARTAAQEAGSGPRKLTLANVPPGDAIAAWWMEGERLAVLHLRSAEGLDGGPISVHPAVAMVPQDVAVRIVAGDKAWTMDGFVEPGTGDVLVDLSTPEVQGRTQGTWDDPASFGPSGASWMPATFAWADDGTMARLESLHLQLAWSNGPGGGADFGIAVGPNGNGGFSYVNADYQATPGAQRETRDLGPADFLQLGWSNGTRPQAGPSVSTGAFATTGIAYEMAWEATFAPDPDLASVCTTLGDAQAYDAATE